MGYVDVLGLLCVGPFMILAFIGVAGIAIAAWTDEFREIPHENDKRVDKWSV